MGAKDVLTDTNVRVREMIEMESISAPNILKFNGHFRYGQTIFKFFHHYLRQQIKFKDDANLATMLRMTAGQIKKTRSFRYTAPPWIYWRRWLYS